MRRGETLTLAMTSSAARQISGPYHETPPTLNAGIFSLLLSNGQAAETSMESLLFRV